MSDVSRSIKSGVGSGLIAGVVFAIAQVIATVAMGEPAIVAFRRYASILLGPPALASLPAGTVISIGLFAHLYLSAMYGLFYGVYNSALTMPTRRSFARQAAVGSLFGVMLWLINFHVFALYRYPWLLELPRLPQLVLHALCFGLPLGLLYAAFDGRVTRRLVSDRSPRARLPRARLHSRSRDRGTWSASRDEAPDRVRTA